MLVSYSNKNKFVLRIHYRKIFLRSICPADSEVQVWMRSELKMLIVFEREGHVEGMKEKIRVLMLLIRWPEVNESSYLKYKFGQKENSDGNISLKVVYVMIIQL